MNGYKDSIQRRNPTSIAFNRMWLYGFELGYDINEMDNQDKSELSDCIEEDLEAQLGFIGSMQCVERLAEKYS